MPVVCVMNGGGIRADLPTGDVTFGDVATVLPFGNVVEVLEITGAQLKQVLEFGFDAVCSSLLTVLLCVCFACVP